MIFRRKVTAFLGHMQENVMLCNILYYFFVKKFVTFSYFL